jgi:hypothetical protein
MTNPIDRFEIAQGPSIYYDPTFRVTLESHLQFIINHSSTTILTLATNDSYRFEGDFYGLLGAKNIPAHLHWLIMRMNGLTSTTDFKEGVVSILTPNENMLENIRNLYMVNRK